MLDPKKLSIDPPPHPGQVLKKDYIEPLGISVTDLSAKLGVSRNTLSSIINRRSGVSADMALRFARALKTPPEFWLKLEYSFQLYEAQQYDSGWREVEPIRFNKSLALGENPYKRGVKAKRLPRVKA
ncbi:MAG: HigA family addiction module antidote protein [Deltaproteobacteria bacterium]|jgi:addiction module HigA family antidote|nr:HigA family addiction module antidote protein [Deltaproteobacteria bacterium]